MEIVAVLVFFAVPITLVVWLISRAISAGRRLDELARHVGSLELEVSRLKSRPEPGSIAATIAQKSPTTPPPIQVTLPSAEPMVAPPMKGMESPPFISSSAPTHASELEPVLKRIDPPILQPPPINTFKEKPIRQPDEDFISKINWEQFMGVKLFAWVGGLALFLGVAFFVKYSFDNNLVSPQLRVAMGFIAGMGLLIGGVTLSQKNYANLSQTLCGTGIVILYAVTFACRSIYHFEFFGAIPTFLLMVLITTTAFLLAVRLCALVVAILGMLGGFLTPILISTGQDNPLGLFGYIAILDAGLIAVALYRRWFFLAALAAVGTGFMQIGWAGKFFTSEGYFEGNKILIALAVLIGFNALYLAASWWAKSRQQTNKWFLSSALGLAAVALTFTVWFLSFAPLAHRPWLMFGFVFLVDLCVATLVLLEGEVEPFHPIAGLAVFGLLASWTKNSLSNEMLNAALVFYLLFAVFHSVYPVFMQRRRGVISSKWATQLFPLLALALVLIPIFQLAEVSFIVWPFILLVDLLVIGLAVITVSILPVLIVLALTLGATGILIFKIPATLTGLPTSFFLLGAFAVFFVTVGLWLTRKFKPDAFANGIKFGEALSIPANLAAELPAISSVLPFLLLIMATLRLPLTNPSPVFGLALLLTVLLLGVTKLFSFEWMPAIGLVCVAALECAWHFNRFDSAQPVQPLIWYLVFLSVFAVYPFLFLRQFSEKIVPWATAAMACLPQFFLIHRLVTAAYPNQLMGLLPTAFAILPLLSLVVILKRVSTVNPARITQLAWFGGVALFFITLIFPIQFERQWITIGWALEGAALLWLFHRLPHTGLRLVGAGLLVAAFVRLALNPAVFEYHARSATPIVNWYLYAYGIVTVCLFCGARLLAPPRNFVVGKNAPPVFTALGTVLTFLLLNIEIADFFSEAGSTLTFQFSGSFARDMTYSIAWALFALVLLIAGIVKTTPSSRYAAVGLLSVTMLKLFFHDLASLGQLYRIGALIGVAIIAMLASFVYQRFFITLAKNKQP